MLWTPASARTSTKSSATFFVMLLPFLAPGHICGMSRCNSLSTKRGLQDLLDTQHKTEHRVCWPSVQRFRQAVDIAERGRRHMQQVAFEIALHSRSTTIRLRIKQGMQPAQADTARERGSRRAKE